MNSEDPLGQVNWKRSINGTGFNKYWLPYIHKSSERILNDHSYVNTIISNTVKYMSERSNQFYFYFGKVVHPQFRCRGKDPRREVAPSFQSKFYWSHIDGCYFVSTKYHRNFILHSLLRLNITFITLKLKEIFGKCLRYKLLIESFIINASADSFTYCGIHSQFSLYPSSIHISFSVVLHRYVPVDLHVAFCVTSKNIIKSEKPNHKKRDKDLYDLRPFSVYYVHSTQMTYFTYKICQGLKKYMGILLYFGFQSAGQSAVYLGPGFLSRRIDILPNHTYLDLQTFQCVFLTWTVMRKKQTIGNITYGFRYLPKIELILAANETYHISYPGIKCRANRPCILHLLCPDRSYINLTILSYVYKGPPSSQCSFGGLDFYDFKSDTFREELLLCNRYNYFVTTFQLPEQPIYSSNSTALLILYSYEEYSQLIINGSVSVTSCRGVKINICTLNYMSKILYKMFGNENDLDMLRGEDDPTFSVYSDPSFNLTQEVWSINMAILKRIGNRRKYYLNLFDKSCTVLQFSSNAIWHPIGIANTHVAPREHCGVHLLLEATPQKSYLWQFNINGFLEHNLLKSSRFRTVGDAEYTEASLNEWNYQNKTPSKTFECFRNKRKRICNATSKNKNIFYFMKCYINTPTHSNTISFRATIYTWSHSSVNCVIKPSNVTFQSAIEKLISINFDLYYVQKVVRRPNVAYTMKILSNETLDLKINVFSSVFRAKLNWTQVYQIKKYQKQNILIALPGEVEFITLQLYQSNVSKVAEITYSWIDIKSPKNFLTCYFPSSKEAYIQRWEERKSVKGNYHFIRFYNKSCMNPQKATRYCYSKLFSWNEAQKLCMQIDGMLPEFYSREEQEELVTLLKIFVTIPIEGLFIGLKTVKHPQ